jgi:hypothetical protein
MVDPNLSSSLSLLHMPASRPEIDGASGGSINDSVWTKVIQRHYNNVQNYKPPFCFPDDQDLRPFNPNDASISARGSDNMKSQWASLRLEFSVCYARWGFSGQNDPETFPNFCQGRPFLIYMFCVMGSSKELMGQTLRFLPELSLISSDDLDIDTLCDTLGTRPGSSSGYQDNNNSEGSSAQPNNDDETTENSGTPGVTEPGMHTKTPK